ncbi:MAG: transporter substrate-binding domain-containing protein, partial [Pseudomonadota bacterium]
MITVRTLISLLVLLLSLVPGQAQTTTSADVSGQQTLRIGTEGAYPPFNYVKADGSLVGFDIAMTKELCRRIGAKCTFTAYEWPALVPTLLSGQIDAISASMSITQRRKEIVAFTDKYFQAGVRFATCRSGRFQFTDTGLRGKTIGVQTATTSSTFISRAFPS